MDLLERMKKGLLVVPGCFDVISAMLIEDAGYEALFVSGYGISASALGYPDIGLMGMSEMLAINRNIAASVQIPVITDIDNAYGDVDHVKAVIHSLNEIGVSGVQMEDQAYPKSCGHSDGKQTISVSQYLRKLETAIKHKRRDMIIIARTDVSDVNQGIERLNRYHDTGADVLIMDGLRTIDDVKLVSDSVRGPVMLNLMLGGKTPIISEEEVAALGVNVLLYSTPMLFAVKNEMAKMLDRLQTEKDLSSLASDGSCFKHYHNYVLKKYQRRFE